jgi:hypothetical protein
MMFSTKALHRCSTDCVRCQGCLQREAMPLEASCPQLPRNTSSHPRHRSRFTRSQEDQATMHIYLAAQRPQIKIPACRTDCLHVAEASHVL